MAELYTTYPYALVLGIRRDPVGSDIFKVTKQVYKFGTKVSEEDTEYEIPVGAPEEPVAGLIQASFPDTYNTITAISQLDDGNKITITQRGLQYMCANCTSLESVVVKDDFDYSGWTGSAWINAFSMHQYAFYNCTSLVSVDFDDLFTYVPGNNWGTCQSMFQGCSNLTTITTSNNKIQISLGGCKDMFKGCAKLTGLNIVCDHDLSEAYTPYGSTEVFTYGYEYLGLTAGQFTQVEA